MVMELQLLFHNIGYILSALTALYSGLFVYLKDRKNTTNIMFGLASLGIIVYCISRVIGLNIADPTISRWALMFNMVTIPLTIFMVHSVISILGKIKSQKPFLITIYVTGAILLIIYIVFPDSFLLLPQHKLYFLNYFVPGNLHWLMNLIFNLIIPAYLVALTFIVYRHSDWTMKNRLKYVLFSYVAGYGLGALVIPLVYGIEIDPILAAFFVPIYAIPLSYAIVQYNLMDISIVAKRAFYLAIMVGISSFGIFLIGMFDNALIRIVPNFPVIVLPFLAGTLATGIGFYIWNKFQQSETLKYEFVKIMTHKLRTPLTSIRWSVEDLSSMVPESGKKDVSNIQTSVSRLVELTNILSGVSADNQNINTSHIENVDFVAMCRDLVNAHLGQAGTKNITVDTVGIPTEPAMIRVHVNRLISVVEILLDNAIIYTPKGGKVTVSIQHGDRDVVLSVADTGIGIAKNEIHNMFSNFYRTETARNQNTEGVGVGLNIAKSIVERFGGRIWVKSEGTDKGSTFFVSLPIVR